MNQKRLATVFVWTLAIVLPGGLAMLALWLSMRAARSRAEASRADAHAYSAAAAEVVRNFPAVAVDTLRDAPTSRAFSWNPFARRVAAR